MTETIHAIGDQELPPKPPSPAPAPLPAIDMANDPRFMEIEFIAKYRCWEEGTVMYHEKQFALSLIAAKVAVSTAKKSPGKPIVGPNRPSVKERAAMARAGRR